MPNIKPISDLRNYTSVLSSVAVGEPVFLTKNGRGKYALMEIDEYEKMKAELKLMSQIYEGEASAIENGWISIEDVEKKLGITNV